MKKFIVAVIIIYSITFVVKAQMVDISPYGVGNDIVLSPFTNEFAQIFEQGKMLYIDSKGNKFEVSDDSYARLGDTHSLTDYETEIDKFPEYLPKTVLLYHNQNGYGVLSPQGDILLEAGYDAIDIRSSRVFWKLTKNGKVSFFLPNRTVLPFFEDIGYLDGEYFDVKQDGKWHLYSKSKQKIVTKNNYDGFDYCGGCGTASPYVYVQKNGKWGIMDWNEKILVPPAYEHTHYGMRSDNWVNSFSKNGKPVIVNIPTQKEFQEGEIRQGLLITMKNDKYGAYDGNAREVIPFVYDKLEEPNANSYLGYSGNYLITQLDRKKGVITLDGKVILPTEYDDIKVYDDYFVGEKQQVAYLLDKNNKVLHQVENGEIVHANDYFYSSGSKGVDVFKIKQKAYWGLFFVENGKYIEPEFYDIRPFRSDAENRKETYLIAEKNGLETLFDLQGNRILESCTEIRSFYNAPDGFVSYKKNGKAGIYDLDKYKDILPPMYDHFDSWFSGGRQQIITANINDRPDADPFSAQYTTQHLYNLDGKKLTDFDAEKIDTINNQFYLLKIKNNKGYALLNIDSLQKQRLHYSNVYTLNSAHFLLVSNDNKAGKLYDINLKKELDNEYDLNFYATAAVPENPGKKLILLAFRKDIGIVYNKNGYGYINRKGELFVEPQYDWVFDFVGDAAVVLKSEDGNRSAQRFKMGIIDKKGRYIFPMEYDFDNIGLNHVESFFVGNSVKLGKHDGHDYLFGLGNVKTGKMMLPMEYSEMRTVAGGRYLLLRQKNSFGIADSKGEILVPVEYDNILFNSSTYYNWHPEIKDPTIFPLLVYSEGKWRYINEDGTYLPIVGDAAKEF